MLEELKENVCKANLALSDRNLVILTWGNVSAFDKESERVVIKPSGVEYFKLSAENMVVVDLKGNIIEGQYKPSCDTPTHLELYKNFPELASIVHTHSVYATSFAQAGQDIPALGTTHADYFNGPILCTRQLTAAETEKDYEVNTGRVIAEILSQVGGNYGKGILVRSHGVFAWGDTPIEAVDNAQAIENIAQMALFTQLLNNKAPNLPAHIQNIHFQRKHGKDRYYGQ